MTPELGRSFTRWQGQREPSPLDQIAQPGSRNRQMSFQVLAECGETILRGDGWSPRQSRVQTSEGEICAFCPVIKSFSDL
jgi:hypothetical protein